MSRVVAKTEEQEMGRTYEKVKMWNVLDESRMRRGEEIPMVEVRAQVDNGATYVILPPRIVEDLQLMKEEEKMTVRYADERRAEREVAVGLRLEILGRLTECRAIVEPERKEPLIGQVALETLDLWIDSKRGKLIPNPESPDAPLLDALRCSEARRSARPWG